MRQGRRVRPAGAGTGFSSGTIASGMPAAELRGLAVGVAVTAVLLAGAAALIASGRLPEDFMRIAVDICAFLGAMAGGLAAASRVDGKRLLSGAAVGGMLLLICLGGALFGGGGETLGGRKLAELAALVPGGAFGGAAAAFRRGRRH
ncbi:MAG: TIGR04086 family membrane protein [Oscillospiraceae bacterium]|nr:TIGR04086 family membrane protein [Oscillospiraceae bacterium]